MAETASKPEAASFSGADFYAGLEPGGYVGDKPVGLGETPAEYTLVTPKGESVKVTDKRGQWQADALLGELSRGELVQRLNHHESLQADLPDVAYTHPERRSATENTTVAEQRLLEDNLVQALSEYMAAHPDFAKATEATHAATEALKKEQLDRNPTVTPKKEIFGLKIVDTADDPGLDKTHMQMVVSKELADPMSLYLIIRNEGADKLSADTLARMADYFYLERQSGSGVSAGIEKLQLQILEGFEKLPPEGRELLMADYLKAGTVIKDHDTGQLVAKDALGQAVLMHLERANLRERQQQERVEQVASGREQAEKVDRFHKIALAKNRHELHALIKYFEDKGDLEIVPDDEWPGIDASSDTGRQVLGEVLRRDMEIVGFDQAKVEKELAGLKTLKEVEAYKAELLAGRHVDPTASEKEQAQAAAVKDHLRSPAAKAALKSYLAPEIEHRRNEIVIAPQFRKLVTRSDVARVLYEQYEPSKVVEIDAQTGQLVPNNGVGKIALEMAARAETRIDKKQAESGQPPEFDAAADAYWRGEIAGAKTSDQLLSILAALSRAGLVEPGASQSWPPTKDSIDNPDGSDGLSLNLGRAARAIVGFDHAVIQRELRDQLKTAYNQPVRAGARNPDRIMARANELIAEKTGADKVIYAAMVEPLAFITARHEVDQQFSNVKTSVHMEGIMRSEAKSGNVRQDGDSWVPLTKFGQVLVQSYRMRHVRPFDDDAERQAASNAEAVERGRVIVEGRREAAAVADAQAIERGKEIVGERREAAEAARATAIPPAPAS